MKSVIAIQPTLALALLFAPSQAFPAQEPFRYSITATTTEHLRVVDRQPAYYRGWGELKCEAFGEPVACAWDRYACTDDPAFKGAFHLASGEEFPQPISLFNYLNAAPFINITDPGGHVHFSLDQNEMIENCDTGIHDTPGDKYFTMAVHHTDTWDSRVAFEFFYRIDKVSRKTPERTSVHTHSGSAVLDSIELLNLPVPVKQVDVFTPDDGIVGSGIKPCISPPENRANEPVCVASPAPVATYNITVDNLHVVAAMFNTCDITTGPTSGDKLCASLNNIGITIPPVVTFDITGEGINQDGTTVGRAGSNVCIYPTVFSFDPTGATSWWADWLGTNPQQSGGGRIQRPNQPFCSSSYPVGYNRVTIGAFDKNGLGYSSHPVLMSKGPVGLIHGYLGDPSGWDTVAPRLTDAGWNVDRINMQDKLKMQPALSIPIGMSTEVDKPSTPPDPTPDPTKALMERPSRRVLKNDLDVMNSIGLRLGHFQFEIPGWIHSILMAAKLLPGNPFQRFFASLQTPFVKFPIIPRIDGFCVDLICVGGQINADVAVDIDHKAISGDLFLEFSSHAPAGTPIDKPLQWEAELPMKIGPLEFGYVSLRYSMVARTETETEFGIIPTIRFTTPLLGLQVTNGNIHAYEQDVKAFTESMLSKSGYQHMALIGHSMGAVLTHSLIDSAPVRGQVDKAILLAGPHKGSDTAYVAPRFVKFVAHWALSVLGTGVLRELLTGVIDTMIDAYFGEAGRMLEPHSTFMQGLNRNYSGNSSFDSPQATDALADDVDIRNYVGLDWGVSTGATLCHFHIGLPFSNPLYQLPNTDDFAVPSLCNGDMVVEKASAGLRAGRNVVYNSVSGHCAKHTNIHTDCDDLITRWLTDLSAGASIHALRPPPPQGQPLAAPSRPVANHFDTTSAMLAPGQGMTLIMHADSTMQTGVFVATGTGPIDLTVTTPSGVTLVPPPGGPASGEQAAINLAALVPGEYTAVARLAASAPDSAAVSLSGHFLTDVFLGLRAAGATSTQAGTERVPGEDVLISAAFVRGSTPPSHGTVTCTVRDPSGSERVFPLFDDGQHLDGQVGDGLHAGTIPAAWVADPGNYRLVCGAIGTFGGEVIERHGYLNINVRYPSDFGIVDGSLSVAPAAIEAGNQATLSFAAFNHTSRAVDFLTVEASERLADGRERLIGCFSFSPLSGNSTMPGTISWTPAEEGCRDVSVTITGITSGAEMSNSPQVVEPRADNRRTIRVCVRPSAVPLVADPGGPYSYQLGSGRIVLDGSGSTGVTADTQYLWTLTDNTTRLTDVIASATGKHALVELPPGKISADVELTLVDPKRGSATATTTLVYVDSLYLDASGAPQAFQDRAPPVAILDIPPTAKVGEAVTFHSLSTDNFGTPPVQLFRIHGVEANDIDGFGRAMTTVFRRPGSYQVDLLVQDNAGFKSRDTKTIVVSKPSPAIASIVMPQQLESGREITAWVTLTGLAQAAGQSVQLNLGSQGNGSSSSDFLVSASNVAQTDACGIARVPVVPRSRTLGPMDVAIEVLGTSTCDLATGACSGGVAVYNPSGKPTFIDETPPQIMLRSPAPGADQFDACEPLRVSFLVVDEGSGVNPSSIRVTLDGALLPYTGNCATSECVATVDTAGLKPGPHSLLLTAQDNLGNKATLQRDFTIAVSLKSLVCLLNSPICTNISAEAMAELLEEIAEARTAEAARNLVEAAEELSGVAEEACEHGGRGIPQACADRLFDQALAIITLRWGQTPEKDLTEECSRRSHH